MEGVALSWIFSSQAFLSLQFVASEPSTRSVSLPVIGAESLYVVDVSVFPTSIGANPMQSIYTFAKIFADRKR